MKNILVTGGGGYVGSVLIPKLLAQGYHVKVLDLFIYGQDVLDAVKEHPELEIIKGDIRDQSLLAEKIPGSDAVIHLACISNDPSYELNPDLGKSINYDAFLPLVDIAKRNQVPRFIFASSSSVYGIKEEENVSEDLKLEPLTDYSKYKALCEEHLLSQQTQDFTTLILRPATVCGYSPRLRLDLTVNILTNHAISSGTIKVFGGEQKRPNIHIEDVTDLYIKTLEYPKEKIAGKIFNAGYENHSLDDIAQIVKKIVAKEEVRIIHEPTSDKRSYHISSKKIKDELGYQPERTIEEAVSDLKEAFQQGKIIDSMNNIKYYNIKMMQSLNLT